MMKSLNVYCWLRSTKARYKGRKEGGLLWRMMKKKVLLKKAQVEQVMSCPVMIFIKDQGS